MFHSWKKVKKESGIYFELYYYDTHKEDNEIVFLGSSTIYSEGIYTITDLKNPGTYGIVAYDSDGENKTSLYSTTTTIYNTYNSSTVIANYNETNDTLNLAVNTASHKDISEISVSATIFLKMKLLLN